MTYFCRLEIVSHRTFMGRILAQTQGQKGWPMYAQLLIDLVKPLLIFSSFKIEWFPTNT